MAVWFREIVGWVLLAGGLVAFALSYHAYAVNRRILLAGLLLMIGFWVFRGGQHLLKVAIAARLSREAVVSPTKAKPARRGLAAGRPVAEPRQVQMPGPAPKVSA
jgi:hypothetical protein